MAKAWYNQSQSLIKVQETGPRLESSVRDILGWSGGRIIYDLDRNYDVQTDAVYPSPKAPKTFVSITQTNPDTPGHSNENKLHLKVGELVLLKNAYPQIRAVLAVGGTAESWLSYVLKAFNIFYDEVLFLWTAEGQKRLREIAETPLSVELTNESLWQCFRESYSTLQLSPPDTVPPCSLVRYQIADILKAQQPIVDHPSLIKNEIARLCMQRSKDSSGTEWKNYRGAQWQRIEMSRSYFNPLEAIVEIILDEFGFSFEGGIAQDVEVDSLLHDLGLARTKVSEDFVLYSEKLEQKVYIQCKASGGGREQHGKNIQNRTKEQITRRLLYSCRSTSSGDIIWKDKDFHWISILDGDWGVNQKQPLKYIHMLELAGYDKFFCAGNLLNDDGTIKRTNNPLLHYLENVLQCRKSGQFQLTF